MEHNGTGGPSPPSGLNVALSLLVSFSLIISTCLSCLTLWVLMGVHNHNSLSDPSRLVGAAF